MNKRILKLFNEAGFHQPEMERLGIEDKFEKFAELIVGECMTIAQEYDGAKLGGPGLIIAMRIEQHFGVDE